jgi:hypothetical protein
MGVPGPSDAPARGHAGVSIGLVHPQPGPGLASIQPAGGAVRPSTRAGSIGESTGAWHSELSAGHTVWPGTDANDTTVPDGVAGPNIVNAASIPITRVVRFIIDLLS